MYVHMNLMKIPLLTLFYLEFELDTLIIGVAHFPAVLPACDSVHLLQKLNFVNFVADTFCRKLRYI